MFRAPYVLYAECLRHGRFRTLNVFDTECFGQSTFLDTECFEN